MLLLDLSFDDKASRLVVLTAWRFEAAVAVVVAAAAVGTEEMVSGAGLVDQSH